MRIRPRAMLKLSGCVLLAAVSSTRCSAQDRASEEQTIRVGGVERSFIVHIPTTLQRPAPVVLVFHGAGGSPAAIERKTGMDELADQSGSITVYPAGVQRAAGGGAWNIGGAIDADDVGFVKAILTDLQQHNAIDRNRIYALGFSMGGIFSYRLACKMSDTFAAIAAVSATMVEQGCHPNSPVAVFHIHGTNDDRIPIDGGRGRKTAADRSWPSPQQGVTFWSRVNACAPEPTRDADGCLAYGQCKATVEYCKIEGGGHVWPEEYAGRIWAFFAANPKRGR